MKRVVSVSLLLLTGMAAGYYLGRSSESAPHKALTALTTRVLRSVSQRMTDDIRARLLIENPELALRIAKGGSFGGKEHSALAAQHMYSRTNQDAIADVRKKTTAIPVAPRTWLIRMPLVNAVLFDTDDGLVLVDTGMAVAGPALHDAIRSVSGKPLHTIIYTHFHMDHAGGTWALLEQGQPPPQIVATKTLEHFFEENIRIRGNMAKYHSQPLDE